MNLYKRFTDVTPEHLINSVLFLTVLSSVSGSVALAQLTQVAKEAPGSKPKLYNRDSFKQLKQPPANFPAPLYTSNVVSQNYAEATSIKGMHSSAAIIKTSDSPSVAFQWYQSSIPVSGFQIVKMPQSSQPIPPNVEAYTLKARKEGQVLTVSCYRLPKSAATVINVTNTSK